MDARHLPRSNERKLTGKRKVRGCERARERNIAVRKSERDERVKDRWREMWLSPSSDQWLREWVFFIDVGLNNRVQQGMDKDDEGWDVYATWDGRGWPLTVTLVCYRKTGDKGSHTSSDLRPAMKCWSTERRCRQSSCRSVVSDGFPRLWSRCGNGHLSLLMTPFSVCGAEGKDRRRRELEEISGL